MKAGLYFNIRELRRNDRSLALQREFFARLIGKEDIVFDVGANIGDRTEVFSQLCRQVIAIEPTAVCLRNLQSRFRRNPRVVIEPVGLSECEGVAVLYESDNHYLSSFSHRFMEATRKERFKDHVWKEGRTVAMSTLDQIIRKHGVPTYIKIDVEGYELNVLCGLNRVINTVSFEFTPELPCEMEKCVAALTQLSDKYLFNYYCNEDFRFVLEEAIDARQFVSDVLPFLSRQDMAGEIYAILP